jgi:hypothetical protein
MIVFRRPYSLIKKLVNNKIMPQLINLFALILSKESIYKAINKYDHSIMSITYHG